MLMNLRAELARNALFMKDVASLLHISEKSVQNKMNGTTEFTRDEMFLIKKSFFPSMSIEYLFEQIPKQDSETVQ